MRKLSFVILLSLSLVFVCFISFFLYNDALDKDTVQLSRDSGFYAEPFFLELSAKGGGNIVYTLDGTRPGVNSFRYTEPIPIGDATENENKYSMIKSVSGGFMANDMIGKYKSAEDPEYKSPDYPIDKCTVIRAAVIDGNGQTGIEAVASFFVGGVVDKYKNMNVISLVTDPDNLFDDEIGIYVLGNKFSEYCKNDPLESFDWRAWDANYKQKGDEWKREGFVNVLDGSGKNVLNRRVKYGIQGRISRAFLPKGLNLYALAEDNTKESFGYDFFEDGYDVSSLTLASGGNKTITQFNDYMVSERTSNRNFATTKRVPSVLFIDGEYWGFYWLSERFEKEYFAHYYDVMADDVIMIKNNHINDELEIGLNDDMKAYRTMVDFISNNDMSIEENFYRACELIDIDNYLEYYAFMIYIARNLDWPGSNYALWRTRSKNGAGYADGRWRWVAYDSNSPSMEAEFVFQNTLEGILQSQQKDPMFVSLYKNETFRTSLFAKLSEMYWECFEANSMEEYINNYEVTMAPILTESWKRFYGKKNDKFNEFRDNMESYRVFFVNRAAMLEQWR